MKSFKELTARFKRTPTDVLAVDFGSASVKAVRLHKTATAIVLQEAAILTCTRSAPDSEGHGGGLFVDLPQKLKARYVSVAHSAGEAVIKLLSFPGQFDAQTVDKVVANMGIKDPAGFRIGYSVASTGHGRSESRVLAVALPEELARQALSAFSIGLPAPCSLEVSGLASMHAFLHGPGARHENEAIAVIEFGAKISTFAVFNRGILALIRRFDFGTQDLLGKLQSLLGVDQPTAEGIVTNGSFDISTIVTEVVNPLVRQLVLSRDFVERRDNCQVSAIYTSGGLAFSHDVLHAMKAAMGIDLRTWSPFEGLTVGNSALAETHQGREWQFASAVGAGTATLEGS